uniref:Uncharacterized protein n=1 Tax=Arundo donax TaxID=35708 RepID=A0A0A8YM18_ARUDO
MYNFVDLSSCLLDYLILFVLDLLLLEIKSGPLAYTTNKPVT